MNAVSFAHDLRLTPQARTVLAHLKAGKRLSPMKAMVVYGIARLAARIHELKNVGYTVDTELRNDESGQRYATYSLRGAVN